MIHYDELLALVKKNRSYRRFDEVERISDEQILRWIDLARYIPSGRNMQPLKYTFSADPGTNARIFEHLAWAGYLKEWPGPPEGERPAAYIAVLKDKSLSDHVYCDDGIAIQTILLGAVSDGYGGCTLGSFNKSRVSAILDLPDHLEILWILALGKPVETVLLEDLQGNDIRYWRDALHVHHVPKRKLKDIVYRPKKSTPEE